ncbi:hypothetical protein [Methanococcoides sp. AM1]|uniref:hypothetical protein n=1 Tax=Methanococcoides sp. AM1 TaxID=1201011 RepID=UPI001084057F|nr:hypothetical protein [Methanococcoides sp. AM1]
MSIKVETALGFLGGSLGVITSLVIFYDTIFALTDSLLAMIFFGLISLIVGLVGIAGGNIARTDMKKGGKLMLVSGIIGFGLFFWIWWINPGASLTVGGILAIWDKD